MKHSCGAVGKIVQPNRCVGGHVSVGQNGIDTQKAGAAECGGHSCGDVGYTVQPGRCVGGHVCVCGQPYCCVGGGQMNVCVGGGHVCVGRHPSIVCGTVTPHVVDGHGWHDTFGCDGGQCPGGHVKLWTVGHGWQEYAGCDGGHSGHVM